MKLYHCSECSMKYRDSKLANKCQQWCAKHHSCNLEIIKHAARESSQ